MKTYFGKNLVFIFSIILYSTILAAQSGKAIDNKIYSSTHDSLMFLYEKLTYSKIELKNEIDSLRHHLEELKLKVTSEQQELFVFKYGNEIGLRIVNRQIWKGMTENMLRDSWGEPDKIDKNIEKWGVFTQWYYGDVTFFFRDRKLTDWEEKK